jgi:hypothetical protein
LFGPRSDNLTDKKEKLMVKMFRIEMANGKERDVCQALLQWALEHQLVKRIKEIVWAIPDGTATEGA